MIMSKIKLSAMLIIKNHLNVREILDIHMTLGELREMVKLLETQNTTDRLAPGKYTIKDHGVVLNVTVDDDYDIVINNF